MRIIIAQVAAGVVSVTTIWAAGSRVLKWARAWLASTLEGAVHGTQEEVRRLGQAAAMAEARLGALVAHSDDAWLDTNEFGDVVGCNEAYARLVGVPKGEILNGSLVWRDRVPPDDLARLDAAFQAQLSLHGMINTAFRVRVGDQIVPVELALHPVWAFDKFSGWAGTLVAYWGGAVPHDGVDWSAPPPRDWLTEARGGGAAGGSLPHGIGGHGKL